MELSTHLVCPSFHHLSWEQRPECTVFLQLFTCWRYWSKFWWLDDSQLPTMSLHVCSYSCSCPCLISSTGTIRTCQKFLVKYNKQQLNRMLLDCKTDGMFFLSCIISYMVSYIRALRGNVLYFFHVFSWSRHNKWDIFFNIQTIIQQQLNTIPCLYSYFWCSCIKFFIEQFYIK